VCRRMLEGQEFARRDPYRATTHNKGVMNGIDAVAIACGQDWRAIEAAAHAFASLGNSFPNIPSVNHSIQILNLEKVLMHL
jgi:hydroxymethylglutaryl-CoA reductase